ncbi:putative membrane protein YphA (DoxX/SURF4 family) [Marinoscillum furvescens DSM 4134]|uniref:Putative membrane protein YphA (DoxX/SURF4 family) n=2 Tax=Marinoscillum furvescens TaxID=1026 RepID=A0A3D9L068_MARFU|nr:putative membrane protein YphA (DoxX/SURF4 family) [Marinoscillum furvescens DSM 4134]
MNMLSQIEHWGDTHRASWLVVLRVALGGLIVFKGVYFAINLDQLQALSQSVAYLSVGAAHYVLFAHLLGGPLILLGYFTRTACLMQLPVLIGAVVFVNAPNGLLAHGNSELWVSVLTLLALLLFSVMGAGKFSLDELRRKDEERSGKWS